jgi:HEAT repeat protein
MLADGLGNEDPRIRSRCARALGQYAPAPEILDALRIRLSDDDPDVRRSVALALERLGEPTDATETVETPPTPDAAPAPADAARLRERLRDASPEGVAAAAEQLVSLAIDGAGLTVEQRREIGEALAGLLRERAVPIPFEDRVFEAFARWVDHATEEGVLTSAAGRCGSAS